MHLVDRLNPEDRNRFLELMRLYRIEQNKLKLAREQLEFEMLHLPAEDNT